MSRAGATLLWWVLLAVQGVRVQVLTGLRGQSLSFPALRPKFRDIARVTWRTRGTHIAEAKPGEKKFSVDYLPDFRDRLLIQPTNLSLELRRLRLEDSGNYEVVVDTLSDPTNPKTFHYLLQVDGYSPTPRDTGGHGGSTVTPQEVTEPWTGDPTTQDTTGRQPPDGTGGPRTCGEWSHYCMVKGYLVAAVLGPLVVLVVTVHVVTRGKATGLGDKGSAGSETPGTAIPQGPSPWRR